MHMQLLIENHAATQHNSKCTSWQPGWDINMAQQNESNTKIN